RQEIDAQAVDVEVGVGQTAVGFSGDLHFSAAGASVFAAHLLCYNSCVSTRIPINSERLAEFCRRHHIRRLALFGSVVREDFGPQSDVDVLYEFEPGHELGWEIE